MQAQVLKWGKSLAVRIPKPIADHAQLRLGDPLEIAVAADGLVQIHRVRETPTLAQLVSKSLRRIAIRKFPEGWRSEGNPSNGEPHVPDTGDIVFLDFDPQVGRDQAKRRPALVLTDLRYNRASGLAVVGPLISKVKPCPFTLPITVGSVEGAVLVDQLKSMDWVGGARNFTPKLQQT
jgi:mRNA interferase MazF